MRAILTYSYWGTLLLVSILLVFRFRQADLAARIICLLVWLGLCTESIGYYAAKIYHNNYPVYNICFYIEFALISLYYNFSTGILRRKNIGIYIALSGIILGIINAVFLQPIFTVLNSNFLFGECLIIMSLSLLSFIQMLLADDDNMKFQKMVHFWLPCILLFYQCATLSTWGLYDKLGENEAEKAASLDVSILSINIITYLSYGTVFFLYPKMKVKHVQF